MAARDVPAWRDYFPQLLQVLREDTRLSPLHHRPPVVQLSACWRSRFI